MAEFGLHYTRVERISKLYGRRYLAHDFSKFGHAIEWLKAQGFEYHSTRPGGTIVCYTQKKEQKEATVFAPNSRVVQAYFRQMAGTKPFELKTASESLADLREAAYTAIAALAARLDDIKATLDESSTERAACIKAAMGESSAAWNLVGTCKEPSTADAAAAVKVFHRLAEEECAKREGSLQEADSVCKALTHMKAALELLNATQ